MVLFGGGFLGGFLGVFLVFWFFLVFLRMM